MLRRLEVRHPDFGRQYHGTVHEADVQAVCDDMWTSWVDTCDGVLYHPDGNRIKSDNNEYNPRLTNKKISF